MIQKKICLPRGSKYNHVFKRVAALEPGKTCKASIPDGEDPTEFINKLGTALRREVKIGNIKTPLGCKFKLFTTVDNKIGISPEPLVKPAPKVAVKKVKAKGKSKK